MRGSARTGNDAARAGIDIDVGHAALTDKLEAIGACNRIIRRAKIFAALHLREDAPLDLAQRELRAGLSLAPRLALIAARLLLRRRSGQSKAAQRR